MPKITILMSVYNGTRYLREAIESILRQTWTDYEFLIINDASTDDSREIILSFHDSRIRLVDNSTNIGLTKSLNRGLKLAKGEIIARQDADDISYLKRLERQVQFLDNHPEVVLLGTSGRVIDEAGTPKNIILRPPVGLLAIRWYLMFENPFLHTSVMFRRNVILEKLGGYNESLVRYQDYELWSRAAQNFVVENLHDVLIDCRSHYSSATSSSPLAIGPLQNIAHNNLKVFLQSPSIPNKFAHLFSKFRTRHMSEDKFFQNYDWKQVKEIYEQTWHMYCKIHPDAKFDQTIRSHLAANLYMISYFSTSRNRLVSIQTYIRALKFAPKSKRYPSLIKYIVLWALGESARRFYRRIGRLYWEG